MSNNARASLSLMTTSGLPINVIQTKDIDQFYQKALEENKLGVNSLFFKYFNRKGQIFLRFLKTVSMVVFKIHLSFVDQLLKFLELEKKKQLEILSYHQLVCVSVRCAPKERLSNL
jgi:hypothetical protein